MGYETSRKTFDELVNESGWTKEDGPLPGVYERNKAGERCLWSCAWICDDGFWHPGGPNDIESMRWELRDLGERYGLEVRDMIEFAPAPNMIEYLNKARRHYPAFVWPFGPKYHGLMSANYRPGWNKPAWAR